MRTPTTRPPADTINSQASIFAAPSVMVSSTTTTRRSRIAQPTKLPPSPCVFASLRLNATPTLTPCSRARAVAVATAMGMPL